MAVLKLSQITAAGSAPALIDQLVGVTGGTADNLFSLTQVGSAVLGGAGLWSQGTNLLAQANSASAQALRIYNTTDSNTSPTNFERGVFDWTTTANVLTIGTQSGGTGTAREMRLVSSSSGGYLLKNDTLSGAGLWVRNAADSSDGIIRTGVAIIGSNISISTNQILVTDSVNTVSIQRASWRGTPGIWLNSATPMGFASTTDADGGAKDIQISRHAAGTVGLHHGTLTSAAAFQVYNTSDVASGTPTNYERFLIDWIGATNRMTIGPQAGGTGTVRPVDYCAGSGGSFNFGSYGVAGPKITYISGHLINGTNNIFYFYDIGNSNGGIFQGPVNSVFGWNASAHDGSSGVADTQISRTVAGVVALRHGTLTSAAGLQVYNTSDVASGAPTNYERGVFDWTTTANTLTIGTASNGTGSSRSMQFIVAGAQAALIGVNGSIQFTSTDTSSGGARFTIPNAATLNGIGVAISGDSFNRISLGLDSGTPFFGFGPGTAGRDAFMWRKAASVLAFGQTSADNAGWFQWGGQARVTSDFSVTSSTALVNVTGLTVNVAAGRTYAFETELYVTDAAAGGVQAAIAGTATATAIQYTGYTIADNAIKGKTNATALATAVGSAVTTETSGIIVRITGIITVNVAGTLTVQMAQNTSNGTATIAKRGSFLIVHDMP